MRLVLASASPRRAELLRAAGFEFTIRVADVDESAWSGESPRDYVMRLAGDKARAVARRTDELILAADTTVVVDGEILGKPADAADAMRMLRRLSGRAHQVLTAVCLLADGMATLGVDTTTVEFAPMTPQEVDWYVASGESMDKAGAYGIQGRVSRFVRRIEGSYSNVVGLPVALVYEMLRQQGRQPG